MRFLITFLNCPCCCLLTHVCMPLDDDFWCNFLYFEQFFLLFRSWGVCARSPTMMADHSGNYGEHNRASCAPQLGRSDQFILTRVYARWTMRRAMMVKTVKRAWFLDFDFTCHFYWISSILYHLCVSYFLLLELFLYFDCCFFSIAGIVEKKKTFSWSSIVVRQTQQAS